MKLEKKVSIVTGGAGDRKGSLLSFGKRRLRCDGDGYHISGSKGSK